VLDAIFVITHHPPAADEFYPCPLTQMYIYVIF